MQPATIVSGDELRRKVAATLGGTLQQEAGVNFSSFGPSVGQPILRGQGAPRVMVLQNSMPGEDASNTSGDHANAVEPILADRIEILRGPATLLYGGGAVGGVINVIDNRVPSTLAERTTGAIEARADNNANATAVTGRASGSIDQIAWYLSGFDRENNDVDIPGAASTDDPDVIGSIPNTSAEASQWTAGTSWIGDNAWFGVAVSMLNNDYGIPAGAHAHSEHDGDEHNDAEGISGDHEDDHEDEADIRIDLEQTRADVRSGFSFDGTSVDELSVAIAYTDYEHIEFEGGEVGTRFEVESISSRAELTHSLLGPDIKGALGLQTRHRDFIAIGEEAFVPSVESEAIGIFAIQELLLAGQRWELGARLDSEELTPDNGPTRDFVPVTLSASSLWELERGAIKLALSSSERAPTAEELYSNGLHVANQSYELGDVDLKAEHSLNLDIGYRISAARFDFQVEAFANHINDFIYQRNTGLEWDPELEMLFEHDGSHDAEVEGLPVYQWSAEDATFVGLETELNIPVSTEINLKVFGDMTRAELDSGANVPRLPPWRLGASADFSAGDFSAGVSTVYGADQDQPGEFDEKTPSYTQVGAYLEYSVRRGDNQLMFFLRGTNLLDQDIRSATSLLRDQSPEPGRNISAGARYRF